MTLHQEESDMMDLLAEKGLNLGERLKVRQTFVQHYKDDYPFIKVSEWENGSPKYYQSTIDAPSTSIISNMIFTSKEEANLANAMVLAMGDNFNKNDFIHQFKATLRILGIESEWSK